MVGGHRNDRLDGLEIALGHRFEDRRLLARALTHASFANEVGASANYERLEFLGDAVLGLIAAEWLFRRHPDAPEGRLAKRKSYLVSAPVLVEFARALDLGAVLQLGVGEERSGGRSKDSILADVVEALFGALYLDGGLAAARPSVERVLKLGTRRADEETEDAKTRLQELTQARHGVRPEYALRSADGPDHAKSFTVDCRLAGKLLATATGRSKKRAEQKAAAEALRMIEGHGAAAGPGTS
ncbi:MAG: ribonuclease III [Acidobacteriota bacterium]